MKHYFSLLKVTGAMQMRFFKEEEINILNFVVANN